MTTHDWFYSAIGAFNLLGFGFLLGSKWATRNIAEDVARGVAKALAEFYDGDDGGPDGGEEADESTGELIEIPLFRGPLDRNKESA